MRTGEQAAALMAVLSDGRPHSNAEIGHRTGWKWNHPGWSRVRKYLRNHGVSLVYEHGYWCMTDAALPIRMDSLRRAKSLYSELVTRARATTGAFSRNPLDNALEYEMKDAQTIAFAMGVRMGMSPSEVAEDLKVLIDP